MTTYPIEYALHTTLLTTSNAISQPKRLLFWDRVKLNFLPISTIIWANSAFFDQIKHFLDSFYKHVPDQTDHIFDQIDHFSSLVNHILEATFWTRLTISDHLFFFKSRNEQIIKEALFA